MESKTPVSYRIDGPVALLIGEGGMPAQCAEMLVKAGFDIAGLHSPDEPLRSWARQNNNPSFFEKFEDFDLWGRTISYDYLFSTINFRILSPELLRSPKVMAINYHDAPLPRYAGSNATAWALHNGEATHGITWHVMVPKVDAGDILKQVIFPIKPGETRPQLDQRCYLAAMRAFRELLPDLYEGSARRHPQDLSARTFYRRNEMPPSERESSAGA